MLVEMKNIGNDTWQWEDANGVPWTMIMMSVSPKEAVPQKKLKAVLKLKEAGFTTEEIIELNQAELL